MNGYSQRATSPKEVFLGKFVMIDHGDCFDGDQNFNDGHSWNLEETDSDDDDVDGGDCDDDSTTTLGMIIISIIIHHHQHQHHDHHQHDDDENDSGNPEEEDQRRMPSARPLRFSKLFKNPVFLYFFICSGF